MHGLDLPGHAGGDLNDFRLHHPVTKCIFQNQISGYLIFGFVFSQKYRFPFFHRLFQQLLYLCIFPLHRVYLKIDLL